MIRVAPHVTFTPAGGPTQPPAKPRVCIHLGPPAPDLGGPCSCRVRACAEYGYCSTGISPAAHWCQGCDRRETDD